MGDILFGHSERVTKLSLEKRLDQDSVAEEEGQVQLVALSQEPGPRSRSVAPPQHT